MNDKRILGFEFNKLKKWFLYWAVVGVGAFALVFLVTSTWIGVDVREQCKYAQGRYGGDCVESLSAVVKDEGNSFRERNLAIWALGQLGDERALPVLKAYYTGSIPKREPYDDTLSQYELKKAIKLLEGGFNATAFIWRHNVDNW